MSNNDIANRYREFAKNAHNINNNQNNYNNNDNSDTNSENADISQEDINKKTNQNEDDINCDANNPTKMSSQKNIKPKKKKTHNKSMTKVTIGVTAVYVSMIAYLIYFTLFQSKEVINHPKNSRSDLYEETIDRGVIYSSNMDILAETITGSDGSDMRYYPYGETFAHIVGQYDVSKTGIEDVYDFTMLTTNENEFEVLINQVEGEKSKGNSIKTTLDLDLQKKAYSLLENKKGAVVAIEPSTGKILSLVSTPSYNPNYIKANWEDYNELNKEDSVLLNRATSGLYPPGSTFKIVTSLAYIQDNSGYDVFKYNCNGSVNYNDVTYNCYNSTSHGSESLTKAFANSCNTFFATIGNELNIKSYNSLCSKLLFNKDLPYDFTYKKSSFNLDKNTDEALIAQTAFGQGETLITPLHNALITCAIANDGVLMKTYVVDEIISHDNTINEIINPKEYGRLMSETDAQTLENLMFEVVDSGTGKNLKDLPFDVAGKTGSAEYNSNGDSHGWFVGYAPLENPQIAICVLVENGGTGSKSALPIAKELFKLYVK